MARVLRRGAPLYAATDHPGYASWIAEQLAAIPELENEAAPAHWFSDPPARITTAYEAEWQSLGRDIAYFRYRRS